MDVRVGSFSDPEGLEGLAHFLGKSFLFVLLSVSLCSYVILPLFEVVVQQMDVQLCIK